MAARVWPQFLLYRLRLGRSDAFHLSWPAFGLVLPQHHLAGIVWLLFVYDMRLIQARVNESRGAVERALYTHARSDQLLNISALVPLFFFFNLACTLAITAHKIFSSVGADTFG